MNFYVISMTEEISSSCYGCHDSYFILDQYNCVASTIIFYINFPAVVDEMELDQMLNITTIALLWISITNHFKLITLMYIYILNKIFSQKSFIYKSTIIKGYFCIDLTRESSYIFSGKSRNSLGIKRRS